MRCPTFHVHLHSDGKHWVVRRHGAARPARILGWRRTAILRAMRVKGARFVFVHRKDGTVQYLKAVGRK